MNFQELILYLSDELNWKESPFQKSYFDKTKIQANTPLNLYWLLRMEEINEEESKNQGKYIGSKKYNIEDQISDLGKILIDEQYSNETSISECDIIFYFEDHINNKNEKGLYVKVTAWRDSHNEIFFHHKNWENAREVFPEQKEILVFEKIDDSREG